MSEEEVERWGAIDRMTHLLLMSGVLLATVTGVALFDNEAFQFLNVALGEMRGLLHRVAVVFIGAAIVIHLSSRALNRETTVRPTLKDVKDLITIGLHWFGVKKDYPEIGFHHPGEKLVYWGASFTGLILSGASGILLLFPEIAPDLYFQALLAHDVAFVMILIIISGHFMMSVNPAHWPVLKAMFINGKVSKDWAVRHHPGWAREFTAAEGARVGSGKVRGEA